MQPGVHKLAPNPLVSGPLTTALTPSAYATSGSGAALIAPPKRTSRTVRVELNSLDRDLAHYPLPTQFRWTFPFPVKEVREVRIVGGTLPVPFLNIDSPWNKFTFMDNMTNYTITIPVGFYTITSLLTTVQTLLNGLGGFNTYTVSQNSATGVVQITATGGADFGLLFASGEFHDQVDAKTQSILTLGCPGRLLGFGTADYYGTPTSATVTAPRLPNVWYPLERAYLYMNFDSSIDLRSVYRGSGRREPTAIFYYDELKCYNDPTPVPLTKYLNKETYDTVVTPSPAALSRISYLELSLRDMFYNLINTQGREFTLLVDIVIVD